MEGIYEASAAELIDLGAASVETRGGQLIFGEFDGHNMPTGISED